MPLVTLHGLIGGSDNLCQEFLAHTYPAMVHLVEKPIYFLAILYWSLYGYQIHTGKEALDSHSFLVKALMTALIFSTLSWNGFAGQLYGVFWHFMESSAATMFAGQPTDQMLDSLWISIGHAAKILMNSGWSQFGMILLGAFIFILNCILFVVALLYMIVAKFGLAITMVLLPLFSGFFMFKDTRQWGMNWISMMLNFCFIYILVAAIVHFGFFVFGAFLDELKNEAGSIKMAVEITLSDIGDVIIIELVLIIFMLQVKSWAASLSGGAMVQTLSAITRARDMFSNKD